jgi:hypothetical protein
VDVHIILPTISITLMTTASNKSSKHSTWMNCIQLIYKTIVEVCHHYHLKKSSALNVTFSQFYFLSVSDVIVVARVSFGIGISTIISVVGIAVVGVGVVMAVVVVAVVVLINVVIFDVVFCVAIAIFSDDFAAIKFVEVVVFA